jgi:hypothetical protein
MEWVRGCRAADILASVQRLNVIFTLSSLNVVLVTIERFSFTTRIVLQPHSFLRLHEVVQITALILLTVLLPFFLLREVSGNFEGLRSKVGLALALLFVTGVYFYATGNGLHEVSSFNLNQFCDVSNVSGELCTSFFINDYYTGNIFYFAGGALMVLTILLMERLRGGPRFNRGDLAVALVNAAIYALAIFAYAAFDRVLVGMVYAIVVALSADALYFSIRTSSLRYPVITYTAATYSLGAVLALVFRLH